MEEPTHSYLDQRRTELLSGQQVVPVGYDELRVTAREHLDKELWDYAAGGAGSEDTMDANRTAFRRYRIVPRVLRDISERHLDVELFGRTITAPFMLAPIGAQFRYHDEGELATARAARETGIPVVLSTQASYSIEDLAEANGDGHRYFQLYWPKDWDVARSFVKRAETAGYDGIVLTVDSKISTWRRRNLENAYNRREGGRKAVFESDPVVEERARENDESVREFVLGNPDLRDDPSITWDDLDTLREWTELPIILKGILAEDDAELAAEWGVDGIIVSNHGGRQIDGEVSTLDQLATIIDIVNDDMTVILDSGVRSGADAFKALALGADAVQIGRPYIFGLAIAGQAGVRDVILNFLAELESIVGLTGHESITEVDRDALMI